ncbi:MAG: hypothetical protein KDK08_07235 [Rhizobiaceae bacterium]|nr:hypothetical protein [Rhizobiaceae bacterium]
MPRGGGFYSEEQKRHFAAARALHQQGAPLERTCGAWTRSGRLCRNIPIDGTKRCLRHAGPHAARAYRERQHDAFKAGKISAAEWAKAEAKRARNRIHDRWKRNPWLPGSTIDLGEHEAAFQATAGVARRGSSEPVPPAVLDWLRWRYRRLQLDRRRDAEWLRTVREELPRRLSAAGPAPHCDVLPSATVEGASPVDAAAKAASWVAEPLAPFSKRSRPDRPRAAAKERVRSLRGRGRPRSRVREISEDEQTALATFVYNYRDTLTPLFERCRLDERMQIVEALRAFVANPGDRGTRDRWMHVFMTLNAR